MASFQNQGITAIPSPAATDIQSEGIAQDPYIQLRLYGFNNLESNQVSQVGKLEIPNPAETHLSPQIIVVSAGSTLRLDSAKLSANFPGRPDNNLIQVESMDNLVTTSTTVEFNELPNGQYEAIKPFVVTINSCTYHFPDGGKVGFDGGEGIVTPGSLLSADQQHSQLFHAAA